MQTAMKMVNGRASKIAVAKASEVLAKQGLTISSFIRNSIEHVALTGRIPESGFALHPQTADRKRVHDIIETIEAKPMPGKQDYRSVDEDRLIEVLRMERYGY